MSKWYFNIWSGEISHVAQTPLTSDGHRQDWNCCVEYFNGDAKEFVMPSPSLKIRLSTSDAMEGVRKLKPQLFTGISKNLN